VKIAGLAVVLAFTLVNLVSGEPEDASLPAPKDGYTESYRALGQDSVFVHWLAEELDDEDDIFMMVANLPDSTAARFIGVMTRGVTLVELGMNGYGDREFYFRGAYLCMGYAVSEYLWPDNHAYQVEILTSWGVPEYPRADSTAVADLRAIVEGTCTHPELQDCGHYPTLTAAQ